jgi:hypothetical protein
LLRCGRDCCAEAQSVRSCKLTEEELKKKLARDEGYDVEGADEDHQAQYNDVHSYKHGRPWNWWRGVDKTKFPSMLVIEGDIRAVRW